MIPMIMAVLVKSGAKRYTATVTVGVNLGPPPVAGYSDTGLGAISGDTAVDGQTIVALTNTPSTSTFRIRLDGTLPAGFFKKIIIQDGMTEYTLLESNGARVQFSGDTYWDFTVAMNWTDDQFSNQTVTIIK